MDRSRWLDALLDRVPLRSADLAPPPPGSTLSAVRGDRGLPFVGLGVHTIRYGPAFQVELFCRHGPVSWWQVFGRRVVAVSGPDAVQAVLTDRDKAFASGWPDVIGPWFDGGLLAMDGAEHRTDRRWMQAAYADEALAGYLRRMAEDADDAVAGWPVGRRLLAVPAIRTLSGQITTRALLDEPYAAAGRRVMDAVEACIRGETALVRLPVPGTDWYRAHRARRWLLRFLRRAVRSARQRAGEDFLSVLSRVDGPDRDRISPEQVARHMLFTLIASHDTTTAATVAAVYYLGKNPDWQQRARDEPAALDPIIKESIRLVSPSPIAMRRAVRDTEILGRYVPAGTLVSVCTGVNQLLPELWPEPDRFDPGRFDDARREDRVHRLAWAPFGAGAHKCIGMRFGMLKVRATLDALLRHHEWAFPAGYTAPWRFTSLPAPSDGLPLVLSPVHQRHLERSPAPRSH